MTPEKDGRRTDASRSWSISREWAEGRPLKLEVADDNLRWTMDFGRREERQIVFQKGRRSKDVRCTLRS